MRPNPTCCKRKCQPKSGRVVGLTKLNFILTLINLVLFFVAFYLTKHF